MLASVTTLPGRRRARAARRASTGSTRCSRSCRCRPACPSRPSRSAARRTPACIAVKILATSDAALSAALADYATDLAALVEEKNERLKSTPMSLAASPIRFPDVASRTVMTRRAWWLVVLNFLIPGSAQVLAGNRKLGRFGLGATLTLWSSPSLALVVWFFWPDRALHGVLDDHHAVGRRGRARVLRGALGHAHARHAAARAAREDGAVGARRGSPRFTVVADGRSSPARPRTARTSRRRRAGSSRRCSSRARASRPIDGRYNILLLGGDAGPDRDGTAARQHLGREHRRRDRPGRDDRPAAQPGRRAVRRRLAAAAAVYPEGYGAIDGCEVDVCQLNSIYTEVELKSPEMYPDAVVAGHRARHRGACGMPPRASPGSRSSTTCSSTCRASSSSSTRSAASTINVAEDVPIHADETFNDGRGVDPGRRAAPRRLPRALVRAVTPRHERLRPDGPPAPAPGGGARAVQPGERALQVPGDRGGRLAGREDRHPAGHARLLRRPRVEDEGAADHRRRRSCPTTAWIPRIPTTSTSASSCSRRVFPPEEPAEG